MHARTAGLAVCVLGSVLAAQAPAGLDAYDVVWRTPGRDASASMPIGNGEVGCTVWCEPDGRLCGYVARTDSFSEASRLLKLGKFTLQVRQPVDGEPFEQRLCLRDGCIRVTWGDGERRVAVALFVDSEADVVHLVGESARDEQVVLSGETWRLQPRRLQGAELGSSWTMRDAPADVVVEESADVGGDAGHGPRFAFRHRNATSVVRSTLARQGLADDGAAILDPLLHRAFGLAFGGPGATAGHLRDALHPVLLTPRGRTFALQIAAPCVVDADPQAWSRRAAALLDDARPANAQARTAAWWQAFWARSWVLVHGDPQANSTTAIPTNDHPLRLGVDSGGGNRFVGAITDVRVLDGDEVVYAAAAPKLPAEVPALRGRAFARRLRLEATIEQDPAQPIGRIVDKLTAGGADGFLFDTHPGHALRLIVGQRELLAPGALPPGRHRVAASHDPATGAMALELDGVVVQRAAPDLDPAPPSRLTQAWLLQRWIQAAGGRGAFPIKFNGSIFTVEPRFTGGEPFDADWRKWGDCYWWQNTRLSYHPMLAQGDFEQQAPLFDLYRRTLPLARQRVQKWYGGRADGAWWPETMTPFGSHANGDYGWQRDGQPVDKVLCPWWEHARNQGLELLAMLLDRYDYERDPAFVTGQLLPVADPVLQWFATFYPRGADGRLRLRPTQAIETYWHDVEADMPTVAGLHAVLAGLLALPADLVPAASARAWRALQQALPPLPVRVEDGVRLLAPAAQFAVARSNCESPELYAVFPFRQYGLGKPDLEMARATFARRQDRFTDGWPQDGQDAALLGLVDEAATNLLAKTRNHNPGHRFPAMWGPNFDWCPDQCHGGNLLDVTERMLLQCDGRVIRVLPCWPRQWDVHFRLHAPLRTTVEVAWRGGKLERLQVSPPERRADVVVGPD